jgi:hypothetical protein
MAHGDAEGRWLSSADAPSYRQHARVNRIFGILAENFLNEIGRLSW